jgi:hypothetical protein
LKTKLFSFSLKNALAYYNARVVNFEDWLLGGMFLVVTAQALQLATAVSVPGLWCQL